MKKNAWNIRSLVGGSLGQTNQRTSVIYYKLTNFKIYIVPNLSTALKLTDALRQI